MNNIETMKLALEALEFNVGEIGFTEVEKKALTSLRQAIEQAQKQEIVPLIIEDKFVRNYLWERGLVAVEDRCMRSHPHEKMDDYCQHKTNLARLMNKEAQKQEPVACGYDETTGNCTNNPCCYTSPPPRQPLTDEEIRKWWASENGLEDCRMSKLDDFSKVVRAIEAAHGIKGEA